jgi:hypothetical protein
MSQERTVQDIKLWALVLGGALAVGVLLFVFLPRLFRAAPLQSEAQRIILNADKIELRPDKGISGGQICVTITHPAEIAALLSQVVFEPKGPCPCGPHQTAVFFSGGKSVEVSFCDHCFDVVTKVGPDRYEVGNYAMPPGFFPTVLAQLKAAGVKLPPMVPQ